VSRVALVVALMALAACAKSEEASLVPPQEDDGYNVAERVRTPLSDERELTVGQWSAVTQDDQPALIFGPPQGTPLFSLRCDDGEGLLLQRHGLVTSGGAEMMTLEAGGDRQQLALNPVTGTQPLLRAAIPANGDLLPVLREASGPLTVRVGDGAPLVMPATPLIGPFVAGCSAGEPQAAEAETNQAAPANAVSSR
jgi:hypothetical protein